MIIDWWTEGPAIALAVLVGGPLYDEYRLRKTTHDSVFRRTELTVSCSALRKERYVIILYKNTFTHKK